MILPNHLLNASGRTITYRGKLLIDTQGAELLEAIVGMSDYLKRWDNTKQADQELMAEFAKFRS